MVAGALTGPRAAAVMALMVIDVEALTELGDVVEAEVTQSIAVVAATATEPRPWLRYSDQPGAARPKAPALASRSTYAKGRHAGWL